jgi:hypothetical protein
MPRNAGANVRYPTNLPQSDLGYSGVMQQSADAATLPGQKLSWPLLFILTALYFIADTALNKVALGDGWQIFWPLNGVTI